MADSKKEAQNKLEEALTSGPSTFNEPQSTGGTNYAPTQDVNRSYLEGLQATAEEALRTLPTAQIYDIVNKVYTEDEGSKKGRAKLSPSEANQLYPHMSKPFSEPVDPVVAEELASRQQKINELQSVVDASSVGTAAKLSTQLAIGMFDPINMATGLGVGKAVGVGGRLLGMEKSILFDAAATGGRRFAQGVAQGAVANVLAEPLYAGLSAGLQEEHNSAQSIAFNTAVSAGLHGLVHLGHEYVSPKLKAMMGEAQKADAIAGQAAVANLNAGKVVESGRVVQDVINERTPPPGYEHQPITGPGDFNNRPWYRAAQLQNSEFKSTQGVKIEADYGPGHYFTDSPEVANGYAASKYNPDALSGVSEVRITKENPNILDLNKELPDHAASIVDKVFGEEAPNISGLTGRELFDHINEEIQSGKLPPGAMAEITSALEKGGYDGLTFEGGFGGKKHNVTEIFDSAGTGDANGKVQETDRIAADENGVPKPTPADVQQSVDELKSIKSDALYDQAAVEKMDQTIQDPPKQFEQPEVEQLQADIEQQIAAAKEAGYVTKEMLAELDKIDESLAGEADRDTLIKAAFSCLTSKGAA